MTYQNTSENLATRFPSAPAIAIRKGLATIASFFGNIGEHLVRAGEASSRVQHVEALHAKSDAELAAMGIRRDEIVYHVFKDLYYV